MMLSFSVSFLAFLGAAVTPYVSSFAISRGTAIATATAHPTFARVTPTASSTTSLRSSEQDLTNEEKKEIVGNLVEDDEWNGLSMELSETIRMAIAEDIKRNAREFLGKNDYAVGDISKEIDSRVKQSVADLRSKEDYELGDLALAVDEIAKKSVEEMTGKPYAAGDLSKEIDSRIKQTVADYCGEEEYTPGILLTEIDKRVKDKVNEFTGKDGDYEIGDISAAINERRKLWVKDFLGEEAAKNYKFGDITKQAINNFTGNSEYRFGDLSRKLAGNLFGKKKKED